jgi:hypothetical protein
MASGQPPLQDPQKLGIPAAEGGHVGDRASNSKKQVHPLGLDGEPGSMGE